MKQSTKAHVALLFTQLFFAGNFTAIKFLINNNFAKPFAINILRILIASILFWFMYATGKERVTILRKDWGRFFLCSLSGVALNQLLFIKGLSYTSSIHAALLLLTTPILIVFFAAWILKEKLSWMKFLALGLAIIGSAMLVLSKENAGINSNSFLGDMLIILNAIFYTIYFILVKPLMKDYSPMTIMRVIFTIGIFLTLPFCFTELTQIQWGTYTPAAYFALFFVIILGTFCTYLFNAFGIQKLGASIAGTYIYVQPIFASLTAFIILDEKFTWYKLLAGAFIATGLYLTNLKIAQKKVA